MKAKNDRHTIELPMPGAKGVAGRPRKPDALSDAERAKRYRRKNLLTKPTYSQLNKEVTQLRSKVELLNSVRGSYQAHLEIEALRRENDLLVYERAALFAEVERLKAELAQAK